MTIAIVVRELPYLKILDPIMRELQAREQKYIIYFMDNYKGEKEYVRPNLARMLNSSEKAVRGAAKVRSFSNDSSLLTYMAQDGIKKLISIEVWMWLRKYMAEIKRRRIETYSILYLSDSLWQSNPECARSIDRTYYSSKHLLEMQYSFFNIPVDATKTKFIGSPIFDPLSNEPSHGKDIMILLPNIRKEHVNQVFGNRENFAKIIEKFSHGKNLIFKTRQKQWVPPEITKYAKEVVADGSNMYPPVISGLLKRTNTVVMFFSSGIYECVYGGNYVINIPLPLNRWNWDKNRLRKYFSTTDGNLYHFDGIVESIQQSTILSPGWSFKQRTMNDERRRAWIDRYIGTNSIGGAKAIVDDIINAKIVWPSKEIPKPAPKPIVKPAIKPQLKPVIIKK